MFFFLLSGFVQSYNYFQKPELPFLQRSFLKRYFRLAIPALTIVLMVYVFHRLGLIRKDLFPYNQLTSSWVQSLLPDNLSFAQAAWHGLYGCFTEISHYYHVLWTMSRELISSWLVLIILFVTHGLPSRLWLIAGWLIVQLFVLYSYNAAAFTVGILCCEMYLNSALFNKIFSDWRTKLICGASGLYLASLPFAAYEGAIENSMYGWLMSIKSLDRVFIYLIGSTLLICWLLFAAGVHKILSKKPLLFLGEISFMVYLSHLLILFSFSPWLLWQLAAGTPSVADLTICFFCSFILTLAISRLLYLGVDRPTVKYCNIFLYKLFEKSGEQRSQ